MHSYVNPYSMPVVRGKLAWNAAEPNDPIREGDRVNMYRLRVGTNATILAAEIEKWPEDSPERVALRAIAAEFFDAAVKEEVAKNGLNWLAVPKTVPAIPV